MTKYQTVKIEVDSTSGIKGTAQYAIAEIESQGFVAVAAEHAEDRIHPDIDVDGFITMPARSGKGFARVGVRVVA